MRTEINIAFKKQLNAVTALAIGALFALGSGDISANPLPAFEILVKRCKTSFEARPKEEVEFIAGNGKWVKRAFGAADVAYDVQTTNSLVMPYTGVIDVSYLAGFKAFDAENDAKSSTVTVEDTPAKFFKRLRFAYRAAGDWEFAGGVTRLDLKKEGRFVEGQKREVTREEYLRDKSVLRSCMETP